MQLGYGPILVYSIDPTKVAKPIRRQILPKSWSNLEQVERGRKGWRHREAGTAWSYENRCKAFAIPQQVSWSTSFSLAMLRSSPVGGKRDFVEGRCDIISSNAVLDSTPGCRKIPAKLFDLKGLRANQGPNRFGR